VPDVPVSDAASDSSSDSMSDSAGVPWAGRQFEHNSWGSDDGSAPAALLAAIEAFRARALGESAVVDAVRSVRLLVPLVAHLGEAGENDHGVLVDKSQELSIVTVTGPDGRNVMPVFTSVETMAAWNPAARPVPTAATRVALAAVSEGTDLVVLDPTSATEFGIRRPALWAIAQEVGWTPSYRDPAVIAEFTDVAASTSEIARVALTAGDPDARLANPELLVTLWLRAGLDAAALATLLEHQQAEWAKSEVIATRVDSLTVKLQQA
jgi:SseB protein N-terminal domain